jgi:hypothetical protein
LRRSARRWSVAAGSLVAAAAVLLPYHGIGLPDAFWAAAAGGTTALTLWRWSDLRALAAQPVPEPLDPAVRAQANQRRLEALVGRLPIGRSAVAELHRVQHLSRLRGSAVAAAGGRLDAACKALGGLAPRLHPDLLREAREAEGGLRDLAERAASVERALRLNAGSGGSPESMTMLSASHAELVVHFDGGVLAYEGLVAAAATYVAEDARVGESFATDRLTEATDRLRGIAAGLAELTRRSAPLPGL